MNLARVMDNNYPFQTNIPVYDATLLYYGQMVMRHASWAAVETTKAYINAYTGANTEAEDAVGILMASSTNGYATKENAIQYNLASAAPSKTALTGLNFLPAIVNPGARYFAEYDQTTGGLTPSASTSTTVTIASLEQYIGGGWLYSSNLGTTTATYPGGLRYITVGASGSCTIDSAWTIDASTLITKILPIGHRVTSLSAYATMLATQAAAGSGVFLDIADNWITHSTSPSKHPLRYWADKGLKNLKNVRIEAELVMLRHCYRAVVA